MRKIFFVLSILCMLQISSYANISLPAIFSDHMVLQQQESVPMWGWGKPGEEVTLICSWDTTQIYKTTVNRQSEWSFLIQTPVSGGPYELNIRGYNAIDIKDVLIGEVWLGSGQSNMEWSAHLKIDDAQEEKAAANYPEIRFFTVLTSTADSPQQNLQGEWVKCTPESMYYFSACMYFFGREIHQNLDVPVGLIHSSWGGTPIEIWMPAERITQDRLLHESAKKLTPEPWGPNEPGKAFNAMINPLIPYKIKGALWYQGESNVGVPETYERALSTLIDSWRDLWGYDFSFYYAQIAPYVHYGTDNVKGAIMRDQQRKVMLNVPKSGMVVTADIGDLEDIHPGNKQDLGKRLANWALAHDYNQAINFTGPTVRKATKNGNEVHVYFDHADYGLTSLGDFQNAFEYLDESNQWNAITAKIADDKVVLSGQGITQAQAVRYAYQNDSEAYLFNKAGLPCSTFLIEIN